MKRIVIFQLLILVLAVPVFLFYGAHHALGSFLSGSLLVLGNFVLMGTGWNFVFNKKLIALPVLIIVFKYAILGVIIYQLVKQVWLLPLWFAAGVASMMVASLIYGLTLGFFKEE